MSYRAGIPEDNNFLPWITKLIHKNLLSVYFMLQLIQMQQQKLIQIQAV
jgi:hypothetical protein